MRRTRVAALAALVVCVACGGTPRTPDDVVAVYFASLGRDPMRSLPLTTEAFHRGHGLGLVTTSEARAWRGGAQIAKPSDPYGAAHAPEPVDRAQVAWLAIQNRADFARVARGLVATPQQASESDDAATVTVAVAPARGAPFVQVFRLVRAEPDAAWRIDAIEQSGVAPESEVAAFVAHPTEAARRAIEQRLRARGSAR